MITHTHTRTHTHIHVKILHHMKKIYVTSTFIKSIVNWQRNYSVKQTLYILLILCQALLEALMLLMALKQGVNSYIKGLYIYFLLFNGIAPNSSLYIKLNNTSLD